MLSNYQGTPHHEWDEWYHRVQVETQDANQHHHKGKRGEGLRQEHFIWDHGALQETVHYRGQVTSYRHPEKQSA